MSKFYSTITIFLILSLSLLAYACSDDDGIIRVDYSAAPPPVNLSGIIPDTLSNGILLYTVREGESELGVVNERDVVWMKFTIWRSKGTGPIRDSSYRFGNKDSIRVELEISNLVIATGSYFPKMIAGMNETGFRSAIVPPSVTGGPDSIRYDLDLSGVFERVNFRRELLD
jgi:hypothetical protein